MSRARSGRCWDKHAFNTVRKEKESACRDEKMKRRPPHSDSKEKAMTSLKPVTRRTLGEQVALQVLQLISEGGLKPGDKLPTEHELCKLLKVGRSTLREGLRSLAFVGILEMHAGEGAYVAVSQMSLAEIEDAIRQTVLKTEQDINNLAEARILAAADTAKLCAERADPQEIQELGNVIERQRRCIEEGREDAFWDLDLEFHRKIASGSKNPVLVRFLKTLRDLLHEYMVKSHQVPGACREAYEQHRKIYEAIKEGQGSVAQQTMRDHLKEFQQRYIRVFRASRSTLAETWRQKAKAPAK